MVAVPDPGQILKWLDGPIDLKVEVDTPFLDQGDFALYDTAQYDVDTYGTTDPDWTDVSPYVLGVNTNSGKERWEERMATGTATFLLDNTTGIWTPDTSLPTPWYLPWRPGRRIRLIAIPDPASDPNLPESKVPLWTGEVADANDQFSDAAFNIETVVVAEDFMGRLARINPPALVSPTGVQRTDERVHAALDRADWPMDTRDIQVGFHTMQSSHLAQSVLEECQRAAESEGGVFYVSASGVATFKNRDWLSAPFADVPEVLDNFDGVSLDTALWDVIAGTIAVSGGVLHMEAGREEDAILRSDIAYLLEGRGVSVKIVEYADLNSSFEETALGYFIDSNNRIAFGVQRSGAGVWQAYRVVREGGVSGPTTLLGTYDGTEPYFRIREFEGTLYFETSANGEGWTVVDSLANPFTPTQLLNGLIQLSLYAGDDASPSGGSYPNVAEFDDVTLWVPSVRSTEIQGYLGYDTEQDPDTPHARILDVKPSWETSRIRNDIQVALVGGTVYATEDSASIGLFDRRSYPRFDYQNNVQAEIEFLADRMLAVWKDNRMRIDSVTISANKDLNNEDLNRLFWAVQFGDLLSVQVQTGQGWSYERLVHVFGIANQISGEDWVVTFMLDDAEAMA